LKKSKLKSKTKTKKKKKKFTRQVLFVFNNQGFLSFSFHISTFGLIFKFNRRKDGRLHAKKALDMIEL